MNTAMPPVDQTGGENAVNTKPTPDERIGYMNTTTEEAAVFRTDSTGEEKPVYNQDNTGVAPSATPSDVPVSLSAANPIEELINAARAYNAEGLKIFVIGKGAKHPGCKPLYTKWQEEWLKVGRNPIELLDEHEAAIRKHEYGSYGLWMATGQVSKRVVLDVDSLDSENHWRDEMGDEMFDKALKATSGRRDPETGFVGKHLHFRVRPDDSRPWPGHSGDAGSETGAYDFRGDGGGVVMAPTMHKSGAIYQWAGGELMEAPECHRKEEQPKPTNGRTGGHKTLGDLQLSTDDPGRGNNWLSRVAGHFAKHYRGSFEMYEAILSNLNQASADPIAHADFNKTINSVWKAEQSNADPGLVGYEQSNGWLVGHAGRLFTLTQEGSGDDKKMKACEWANFDVKTTSIARHKDGTRTYDLDLTVDGETYRNIEFDPAIISRSDGLIGWLAKRGALILPGGYDVFGNHPDRVRLAKYIVSQNAPESLIVDHLGWNRQHRQYLTATGVIVAGATEEAQFNGVRPSRDAVRDAKSRYGFEATPAEAVEVLRQVLTFHDETATSVIGAWVMMVILRGQYTEFVKPGLQIDAHSGSAKTTLMRMVLQLIGYTRKGGDWTRAELEDALASNLNSAVWLDDKEIPEELQTTIRQSATGGGKQKKRAGSPDQSAGREYVGAVVITSEGMPTAWNARRRS